MDCALRILLSQQVSVSCANYKWKQINMCKRLKIAERCFCFFIFFFFHHIEIFKRLPIQAHISKAFGMLNRLQLIIFLYCTCFASQTFTSSQLIRYITDDENNALKNSKNRISFSFNSLNRCHFSLSIHFTNVCKLVSWLISFSSRMFFSSIEMIDPKRTVSLEKNDEFAGQNAVYWR